MLILENHSFDQMIGCLKAVYPDLDGVDPSVPWSNPDRDGTLVLQKSTIERQMLLDPHHEVGHVKTQLADGNTGFVRDFAIAYPDSDATAPRYIMGYYPLDFLPA